MANKLSYKKFQNVVLTYYAANGRSLPWRLTEPNGTYDPYKIWISEIMLQQTQVKRVIPKYRAFIEAFPGVNQLANASLQQVLRAWSGLGYNRRGQYLHQSAKQIVVEHNGKLPQSASELATLPGIGVNTAAAIVAYAFNQPVSYIETNIRSVYIHHFFSNQQSVSDKDLLPIIATTLDATNPRRWYWALMDYGTHLKASIGNPSRQSRHYARQSTFEGSKRQLRGRIMRLLLDDSITKSKLQRLIVDERLDSILGEMVQEKLIVLKDSHYQISLD